MANKPYLLKETLSTSAHIPSDMSYDKTIVQWCVGKDFSEYLAMFQMQPATDKLAVFQPKGISFSTGVSMVSLLYPFSWGFTSK